MRTVLTWVLRLVLRIFYREIEVKDLERLPREGPVIVVLNHPNGLIDPLFILCLSPRPVSFLAKAPLFRMPLLGAAVRALGSIPVTRKQDEGSDPARTRETFEKASALLKSGGVLALFPEGTTHDDPRMKALKTGAARIALGAAALNEGERPVTVVPAGLTFPDKGIFRSPALLQFGEPIAVSPVEMSPSGSPPAASVEALTREIEDRIEAVILQAETAEALSLAAMAERILASFEPAPAGLAESVAMRQRLVDGYGRLKNESEIEIGRLAGRVRRFEETLRLLGLDPSLLSPGVFTFSAVSRATLRTFFVSILLLPLAIPGILLHFPAYTLARLLGRRFAKNDVSIMATVKILASLVFYPLTWGVVAVGTSFLGGLAWSLASLVLGPVSARVALYLLEHLDTFVASARAFLLLVFRRSRFLALASERDAIREKILALARRLESARS